MDEYSDTRKRQLVERSGLDEILVRVGKWIVWGVDYQGC